MTELLPLGDNVLVEAIEEEQVTKSGIILPDSNKEKPSRGKVVAVGKGKIKDDGTRASMDVAVGDIVHFTKYAPDELEVGAGEKKKSYLIVSQGSILAIEK